MKARLVTLKNDNDMKRKVYFLSQCLAAMSLLMTTSCQSDENVTAQEHRVEITTVIASNATRVAYDGKKAEFEANDKLEVIGVPTGTTDLTTLPSGSMKSDFQFNGTTWTSDSRMVWDTDDTLYDFYGVYPCQTNYVAAIQGNNAHDDVMFAKTTGLSYNNSGGKVMLAFSHAMAKLVVNISKLRDEIASNASLTVNVKAKSLFDIDIYNQKVMANGNTSSIRLRELTPRESYATLLPSQDGVTTITINDGTKDYTWLSSTAIPLSPNKITTVTLSVGNDHILIATVNVLPWNYDEISNNGEQAEN